MQIETSYSQSQDIKVRNRDYSLSADYIGTDENYQQRKQT
jgi:hypothetical protein